ncbi:MAG: outer membrane beta-barrel protein [Myxococcaceae bacterium]
MQLHLTIACLLVLSLAPFANADEPEPTATAREGTTRTGTSASLVLGGYAEVFYQWNFNQPSNGITNFRAFDNRHNTFTLANAVLDAAGTAGPASARVALQVGHTPESYYLAEPSFPGTGAVGSTGAPVWKSLQQANVGYRAPLGRGLLVEAGLFLSPVGPEGIPIKDQWNWSRSNLFGALPAYHTGARVSYPLTDRFTVSLMVCNGWNSVVDNNSEKSVSAQGTYLVVDKVSWNFVYFTGVERQSGAPEGRPWRHLLDSYVAWYPRSWFALLVHGDGGFEPNDFGTSYWAAGALTLRFRPRSWLYLAGRADVFREGVPENAQGRAAPIFWPSPYVTSQTATLDVRPHDNVSFRVEYRRDQAGEPMYFRGPVLADTSGTFIPNARSQDTLTAGMVAWF